MNEYAGPIAKVKISLEPGKTISEAFTLADYVACRLGMPVAFDFNGQEEVFGPRELAASRVERWFLEQIGRRQREEDVAALAAAEQARTRVVQVPHGATHVVPAAEVRSPG